MKNSIVLIAISLFSAGCSSSYIVSSLPQSDDVLTYSEFNADIKDEQCTITFRDSTSEECLDISSAPDSTSYSSPDKENGRMIMIPTEKIKMIFRRNRGIGFLEGAAAGLLGGGVGGFLIGSALENPNSEWKGFVTLFFSVVFGGAGLIVGSVDGLIVGHSYEYVFDNNFSMHSVVGSRPQRSEVDINQKLLLFEELKKSKETAIPLSLIFPSAGYAYLHHWERGLLIAAGRIGGVVLAATAGSKLNSQSTPINGGVGVTYSSEYEKTPWFYIGVASAIGFTFWEVMDVSDEVDRYNEHLYKKIVSETSLGVKYAPGINGAQLQLVCSF